LSHYILHILNIYIYFLEVHFKLSWLLFICCIHSWHSGLTGIWCEAVSTKSNSVYDISLHFHDLLLFKWTVSCFTSLQVLPSSLTISLIIAEISWTTMLHIHQLCKTYEIEGKKLQLSLWQDCLPSEVTCTCACYWTKWKEEVILWSLGILIDKWTYNNCY